MMDADRLNDRFSRGMGNAARVIGEDYDLFRPLGVMNPLAAENLMMRLPIYFDWGSAGFRAQRGFERALRATFDGISACVGDYLRGPRGVLFIAALPQMRQPICILTNASFDVLRPTGPLSFGLNAYGGNVEQTLDTVLGDWPAQMLSSGGNGPGALPADGGRTSWSVVLPATPVPVAASDVLQDGIGRRFIVRTVEETEMGQWLSVKGTEV